MILIQLIGVVALLLGALSVQFRYRRTILLVQVMASVMWVIHFVPLGATAGAIMNIVGVIRTLSYYAVRNKSGYSWLPWSLVALATFATIITWQGPFSLLPYAAMVLAVYALWQKSEQKIRLLLTICVVPWFIYNAYVMSYAGMASDLIALCSGVIGLYRHRKQGFAPASKTPSKTLA